jgi:hypothetical protein
MQSEVCHRNVWRESVQGFADFTAAHNLMWNGASNAMVQWCLNNTKILGIKKDEYGEKTRRQDRVYVMQ